MKTDNHFSSVDRFKFAEIYYEDYVNSNKFLRIYIANHLNLTLNFRIIGKVVANIDFI